MIFYSTSEPCPTCLSSCIKAKVLAEKFKYLIIIVDGILAEECYDQREKFRPKVLKFSPFDFPRLLSGQIRSGLASKRARRVH